MEDRCFIISDDDNVLDFSTSSFSTLQHSALHSGAFNSELASSVAAGTVMMLLLIIMRGSIAFSLSVLIAGVSIYGLLFLLFRRFVIKEPHLQARFSRADRSVEIIRTRFFFKIRQRHAFDQIEAALLKEIAHSFTNPDGIDVVEKIALDHNTVMIGFGKPDHLYAAALRLADQREIVLFSSENREHADKIIEKINQFLEVKDAETD
ncbi:MAG: hypothetical protein JXR79_01365 [Nitrospirae bacterium]|nr:hypothetical protein [Nitrospirota bacterium]